MGKKKRKKREPAQIEVRAVRRFVALPVDRNGVSIDVGDVLMWDNGDTIRVESLTYFGDEFVDTLGYSWVANDEGENGSDNLEGGRIIWKKPSE